ncbi:MAG TPA: c-type cytochrome [Acidimicrobiales bacterium]|jgi:ubiquinol-cytochrome c reductase cytochrome c subunit|nr:c-type cytochrome [Acidimicrobiales bacterium]
MAGPYHPSRPTRRHRVFLPGALLAVATLGGLALFFPGTGAGGATTSTTTTTPAATPAPATTPTTSPNIQPLPLKPTAKGATCGTVNLKGVSNVYNTGNPNNSTFKHCSGGHIVSYGSGAITYTNPPPSLAQAGKLLYDQTCSSCHGSQANGVAPNGQASIGPNLQGVGAATVDFWITTGRMPAVNVKAIEAERKPAVLTNAQALQVAAYINSLDPAVPAVPTPHLNAADVSDGADLFSLNCAACHTITGAGDALAFGTNAPTLNNKRVTPQQIAEAIRIGPANMPRFSGNLSDAQVRDVVAYVTQNIQHPVDPGGADLGGVGPVAEGFVALLLGVGGLALICFWIGERS